MKLFKKLFSSLNKESIKYLVVGGIAVNLYGIERATADIDELIKMKQKTDRPQDKADIFYLKKIMKETDNE